MEDNCTAVENRVVGSLVARRRRRMQMQGCIEADVEHTGEQLMRTDRLQPRQLTAEGEAAAAPVGTTKAIFIFISLTRPSNNKRQQKTCM